MDSLNWNYYLSIYPDLKLNGINTEEEAIIHWNTFGKKEGRLSSINDFLFNWQFYLDKYNDLRDNGINTEEEAIIHWNTFGKKEGRSVINSLLVDWQYYLDKYPDLRINGVNTEHQAIAHWRQRGMDENRILINPETIYEHIHKILYCQPIFAPDLMRLNKNIVSLESISNYLKKNNINIDTFNFIFGGWCINDDYWDIISAIIIKLFNTVPIRFDKNYGKAYVVNSLIKTAKSNIMFKYILTLDSDILFNINEPNIFERLIYSIGISESTRNIPVGLISLNQSVCNCHLINVYENNIVFTGNYGIEKLVYPNSNGGIAGGCLFITLDGWEKVGGYRVMGVYAGDDAYLLIDLIEKGMSIQMADTINCIHPPELDSTYATWKGTVCQRDQIILNSTALEDKINEANEFWIKKD